MRFAYKTRGGSSPRGKQKVYVCYDLRDSHNLEGIFKHLIRADEHLNFAIWYLANPSNDVDIDYIQELEDVRLFVLVVTNALLEIDSNHFLYELSFAKEKHIPILPIVIESIDINRFNAICGNLHILDECSPTFSEQLQKQLNTVLISDTMANEIATKAFDATLFISYRKKDKAYAQQFISAVHSIDMCRYIAIWYDDFLIAGRAFDEEIKSAIDHCDLFVLTITPNIAEVDNYVMKMEYPYAKEQNKPILAAMMVKAHASALEKLFQGLPQLTDVTQYDHFQHTLTLLLENKLTLQPKSPYVMYLMGMAYLNGVNVEVNGKLSFDLISVAAESGLLIAMTQLANMYFYGIGIPRDTAKGINLQQSAVVTALAQQNTSPSNDNAFAASSTLIDLGIMNMTMEDMDAAIANFLAAEDLSNRIFVITQDVRHRELQGKCFTRIEHIYEQREDYTNAILYHEKALHLYEAMHREQNSTKTARHLASCRETASNLYLLSGNIYNLAEAMLQEAIDIWRSLADESGSVADRRWLANDLYSLGRLRMIDDRLNEAREHARDALSIRKALIDESQALDLLIEYANSLHLIADIATIQKYDNKERTIYDDVDDPKEYDMLELDARKEIAERYPNGQNQYALATCYLNASRHFAQTQEGYRMLRNAETLLSPLIFKNDEKGMDDIRNEVSERIKSEYPSFAETDLH